MEKVKALLEEGKVDEAIAILQRMREERTDDDAVHYELGNAYWKKQDWKHCLDNYAEAIRLNPESPAAEMRKMVMDIIGFYNKEMFNV